MWNRGRLIVGVVAGSKLAEVDGRDCTALEKASACGS